MSNVIIEGVTYPVPDEEDWELGELAEFARLRDKWGDLGATIALVWIVKHRQDPAFTIEQAEHIKVGQVEEEDTSLPLTTAASPPSSESAAETNATSTGPSESPEGSGRPLSAVSTA